MALSYDANQYMVPISAPTSIKINNVDLRTFAFELQSIPQALLSPPADSRMLGFDGLHGSRDFGSRKGVWSFEIEGRIQGLTFADALRKRDSLLQWINNQEYVLDEYPISQATTPMMYFELSGNKWYYDSDVVLVENGSKVIYGGKRTVSSGTTTSTTANKLVNTGATFTSDDVEIGDPVFNTTDTTGALITAIDSDATLSLDRDIMASDEVYQIRDSAKWKSFIGPDADVRLPSDSTKYLTESITNDGKLTLDTAVVRASGSGLAYQIERRRYILVNFDGNSSQSQVSDGRGILSHEPIDTSYSTRANTVLPVTIGFSSPYPWWIGDCAKIDYGQVSDNTFLEMRGIGNGEAKPIYHVIGVATNPRITAAEMAFHSIFNCNLTASDIQNLLDISGSVFIVSEGAGSGQFSNSFTFAADSVFAVDAMNDGSAPTSAQAHKISRNQGKLSVWVKPNWNSTGDSIDRYIFKDSASTNELTLKWDGSSKRWEFSDGTSIAFDADTFTSGDWINLQCLWSTADNVEGSDKITIYVDGSVGTGQTAYLSDTPGTLLYVGGQSTALLGWTGDIDDFAIWRYWGDDVNTNEVADIYNSGTGTEAAGWRSHELMLHLPMDTSSVPIGSTNSKELPVTAISTTAATVLEGGANYHNGEPVLLSDLSGQHVFGVINGTPTGTNIPVDDGSGSNVTGIELLGTSAGYDGSTDYHTADATVGDVSTGDLVVHAYIKTTAAAVQIICCKIDALTGNPGWYLGTDGSGNAVFYIEESGASAVTVTSSIVVNDGKWHSVTFYIDRTGGTGAQFIIDGEHDNSGGTLNGDDLSNAISFRVGALGDAGAANKFAGDIKDVRIWEDDTTQFLGTTTSDEEAFDVGAFPGVSSTMGGRSEDSFYKMTETGVATTLTDSGTLGVNATASGTPARNQEDIFISDNLIVDPECELGPHAGWIRVSDQAIASSNNYFRKSGAERIYADDSSIEISSSPTADGFAKKVTVPKGTLMQFGLVYQRTTGGHNFQAFDDTLSAVTTDNGSLAVLLDGYTADNWHQAQMSVEVANSGADLHDIHFRITNTTASVDELHMDSFFCKVHNLLNPTLTSATNWNPQSGSGAPSVNSADEHSGTNCLSTAGTEDGLVSDAVTLLANQWYEQVGYIRATASYNIDMEVGTLTDAKGDTDHTYAVTTNGGQIAQNTRLTMMWRTTADTSATWKTVTTTGTTKHDDAAFLQRGNIGSGGVSITGSGTNTAGAGTVTYTPGCSGCGVSIPASTYIQFGASGTNLVRGYGKKFGFVVKFRPAWASDDTSDRIIFSWTDDATGANGAKLLYDVSDDDWVVIIRSGLSDDTTLRTTNTQTFIAEQDVVVAMWYDYEGRIDPKDNTLYYGKIFVNGMVAGTITTRPTPPAADFSLLRVAADAPTAGDYGEITMDELGLYAYAPSDERLVGYSRNKKIRNDNATWRIFADMDANDLFTADSRDGTVKYFDNSATLDVEVNERYGRHPGVRGEGLDEYQTLYIECDSANLADLEVILWPHHL